MESCRDVVILQSPVAQASTDAAIGVRLLGPVEIVVGGQPVEVAKPQRRAVLAALAVDATQPVGTEVLVGRVWGEDPPDSAARTLQAHITRLRRLIERSAVADQDPARLVRRSGGYALDLSADRIDLHRFRLLWGRARRPGTTDGERAALLRDALVLWRGQPLTGVAGDWADRVRATLMQQHVAAAVTWARSETHAGAAAAVVEPLSRLVAAYPLAESLTATLMQALTLTGQKADALACYSMIRHRLVGELGVEPGRELNAVHHAVLSGDLDPQSHRLGGCRGTTDAAPSVLPLDIDDFTGRGPELTHLLSLLSTPPRASVVAGIWGRAGTGKTALAVHAAHLVRDRFPDGQLFLDLGGPAQPVPARVAIRRAMTGLGVQRGRSTDNLADQVQAYRAHLATRRVLLVLDSVADERSVRPLLPVGSGSAVVITGRHRLVGLESARWIRLAELDDAVAVRLLTTVAGPGRTSGDPACRTVVRLCGCLPLAVRIAAARLVANPHWSVGELARRLGSEQQRLDELQVGDLDVRASLAISYHSLDDRARQGFRGLGDLRSADFPAWVPAAVRGWGINETAEVLDRLVDQQMLDVVGRDAAGRARYRLHDLLAVFARELSRDHAATTGPDPLVPALTAWLALVDRLEDRLLTGTRSQVRRTTGASTAYPLGWLPAQRAILASDAMEDASAVWELGWSALWSVLTLGFELHAQDDWRTTRDVALLASRRVGDRLSAPAPGEPFLVLPGHHPPWAKLAAEFEQYADGFSALGRPRWQVAALSTLGNLYRAQGRYGEAEATIRRSIDLSAHLGHTGWRVAAHFSLGSLQIVTGRLAGALGQFAECRRLLGCHPQRLWDAYLLRATAYAHHQHGRHRQAIPLLTRCLPVFRREQDPGWEAHTMLLLASAHLGTGHPEDAVTSAEASRRVFRAEGDVRGEAMALRIVGRAAAARMDLRRALDALTGSLAAFVRVGDAPGAALALRDRALVQRLAERYDAADSDQQSAKALFTQLDLHRLADEPACEWTKQWTTAPAIQRTRGTTADAGTPLRA